MSPERLNGGEDLLLVAGQGDAHSEQVVCVELGDGLQAAEARLQEVLLVPVHLYGPEPLRDGTAGGQRRRDALVQQGLGRTGQVWELCLQGGGVSDQPVQPGYNVTEPRPVGALLLPAVQHEGVEGGGAFWGRRQAVVLLDGVDHLGQNRVSTGSEPGQHAWFYSKWFWFLRLNIS